MGRKLRVRKRGPAPGLMVSVHSSSPWAPWLMVREPGRRTFVALLIVRWAPAQDPAREVGVVATPGSLGD